MRSDKSKLQRKLAAKERRKRLKAAGFCTICGKLPLCVSKYCINCKEKENLNARLRRIKALNNGLCANCHRLPVKTGKTRCVDCSIRYKEKDRLSTKHRSDRLRSKGLCTKCGKEKSINAMFCYACNENYKRRHKKHRDKLRKTVLDHYGAPMCACCKEVFDYCFLQLDHVRNDGAEHRRRLGGKVANGRGMSHAVYRWAIKNNFPDSLQVLCANCNWTKGIHGECSHVKEEKELWNKVRKLFFTS